MFVPLVYLTSTDLDYFVNLTYASLSKLKAVVIFNAVALMLDIDELCLLSKSLSRLNC